MARAARLVPATIEAMAADRLAGIIERQPTGPYWLAGYCNGALVAYEVARLLTAAGQRVEFVAMIDPPTASARPVMRSILKVAKIWGGDADSRLGLRTDGQDREVLEVVVAGAFDKAPGVIIRKHASPASVQRKLYSTSWGATFRRHCPFPSSSTRQTTWARLGGVSRPISKRSRFQVGTRVVCETMWNTWRWTFASAFGTGRRGSQTMPSRTSTAPQCRCRNRRGRLGAPAAIARWRMPLL